MTVPSDNELRQSSIAGPSLGPIEPFASGLKAFRGWLPGEDARFGEIVADLPVALYTTDAKGRITFYNDAATALWGRSPKLGEEWWCGSWRLFWPDGSPMQHEECPMAQTLRSRKPVRGAEAIAERPDGSRYWFTPFPTPLFDESGELTGAVNVLIETSDRKAAEETASRLAAIVTSSDDAIISKTLDGTIMSWNSAAEHLFGYTEEEMLGKSILKLIPEDRQGEEAEIVGRLRRGERIEHYETIRQRKDGSCFDISLTVSPIRRADGTIIGASKIARDISARKQAEMLTAELHEAAQREIEHRKRAEESKELLLHEIKHRVKNTLATVQAIATQSFRQAPPEESEAFLARLHALAGAHDLLTQQNWEAVGVRDVVERAMLPFIPAEDERIDLGGTYTSLDSGGALLLALALHELATNAAKYGPLSNTVGTISIRWERTDTPKPLLTLVWRENGGPPVSPPKRRGFGTRMIERALKGEKGTVGFEFDPTGLACTLTIAI